MVFTFTQKTAQELSLPKRAIITFNTKDTKRLLNRRNVKPIEAWSGFRYIYRIETSNTVVARCPFGGANIAALVEELAFFGVQEFVLWGYCGAIDNRIGVGEIIAGKGALREDSISYHYLEETDNFVYTDWYAAWGDDARDWDFHEGLIWSCDAIYRETRDKVVKYRQMGISAVEMELASFYAVCKYRRVKGIAFLVTSDRFTDDKWISGFFSERFKTGTKRLTDFMREKAIC